MKSFFTKLSVLLFGVAFAVAGCQDYDEDIRKVNEQLNANTAELTSITDALDKAIKDLEAKMVADYATKKALADLSAELKAKDADIEAAIAALDAAYKAADVALKAGYEAADATLKADLEAQIAKAVKDAQDANDALALIFENSLNALNSEIAGVNSFIQETLVPYFEGRIDAVAKALEDAQAALEGDIAKVAADLATAKTELTAAYEGAIADAVEELEELISAQATELEALKTLHQNDVVLLQAAIAENYDDIVTLRLSLKEHIDEYKTTVDQLQGAIYEGDEAVRQQLMNSLNAHIEIYETTVEQLQGAIGENTAAIEAVRMLVIDLTNQHKQDVAYLQAAIADNTTLAEGIRIQLINHINEYAATVEQLEGAIGENSAKITANLIAIRDLETLHKTDMEHVQNVLNLLDVALQQETAQRKEADEALQAAQDALAASFEAFKTQYAKDVDNLQAAMAEGDEAVRQQLMAMLARFEEQYAKDIDNLQAAIAEGDAAVTQLVMIVRSELEDHIKIYERTVSDLEGAIGENSTKITANLIAIKDLQTKDEEIDAAIDDLDAAYKAADDQLTELINKNSSDIAAVNAKLEEVFEQLASYIIKHDMRLNVLESYVADLVERLAAAEVNISVLTERVQSLVYVPEYSDGKATLNFALLVPEFNVDGKPNRPNEEGNTNEPNIAFIPVKDTLRFKVNSTSETAVAELVEAYKADPTILSFDLEGVTVRGASAGDAVLEIVGAYEDEDGYLAVEVLARNFDPEFYYSTIACEELQWTEFTGEYAPSKEYYQGIYQIATQYPNTKGYSASLVLNQADQKNNVASEFTNLIAGNNFEFLTVMVVDGEGENITGLGYGVSEPVKNLPYDLDPEEEVIVLEDHKLMFVLDNEEYTTEEMIEMGYGVQLERRLNMESAGNKASHLVDLKPQVREVGPFGIWEDPIKSIEVEGNTYVTLREGKMSKEEYLRLKEAKQNNLSIKYLYDINGLDIWTESGVEITNRLVNVNLSVTVPWTLETALKTVADGKLYQAPVVATFEYDLTDTTVVNKSLEGYSLYSIVHAPGTETSYLPAGTPISLAVADETITATLKNGSKSYAFPANNNDDKDDYNTYTVVKKAEFSDLTVVVTVAVKLGEQAPEQFVTKDVTFTTQNGANGWLFGYWNAVEDAYKQFNEAGYVGYTDKPETGKAKFVEAFDNISSYTNRGDYLMVNGEAGISQNVNIPFTANNNEDGEHKFQLWHEQLVDVNENGVFDNDAQEIVQKVGPYFGIPFTFVVNATVDIPDYALDLDPVRVQNNIVDVYGELEEISGKTVYTVSDSDLAKYFYVVNKTGVRELKAVNADDNVTVKFDLISKSKDAKGNDEMGFEFKGEPDVITNTLAVDWTSSEPYILPMGDAVATWGTYNSTEVGVVATLYVNGFKITTKEITLVTKDPLDITFENVDFTINNQNGTINTTTAYIYKNFKLTSIVEKSIPNLFDVTAKSLDTIFDKHKANVTYGADIHAYFLKVYYKDEAGNPVPWDMSKITLGNFDKTTGEFDGTITINADDGNIQTPIYVDVRVKMSHRIHAVSGECESEGDVTVTFNPAK